MTVFYAGLADPLVEEDLSTALEDAKALGSTFSGLIREEALGSVRILNGLKAYEAVQVKALGAVSYATLVNAVDPRSARARALWRKVMDAWRGILGELLFLPLQLSDLGRSTIERLAASPELCGYKHYLRRLSAAVPHMLPEPLERMSLAKNRTGREAWRLFYERRLSGLRIRLGPRGRHRVLGLSGALELLHDAAVAQRTAAFKGIQRALKGEADALAQILDTLVRDRLMEEKARGISHPLQASALDSEVEPSVILDVLDAVEAHYGKAQRYFRLKARAFGLRSLPQVDLFAPWPGGDPPRLPFEEAMGLLGDAAREVHPRWHAAVISAAQERRIHWRVEPGKQAGGFCHCLSGTRPPYILITYGGDFAAVRILAHELGHAIHYGLAAGQSHLNFKPSVVMEETASTLFELLAGGYLLKRNAQWAGACLQWKAATLEGLISTVFRQVALTRFELELYRRGADSVLAEEDISALWCEENEKLYGRAVKLSRGYRRGWAIVPHFFHRPLTCYGYVFGSLISLCLYRRFLVEGRPFMERVNQMLETAGGQAPADMLSRLGIDLEKSAFVEEAMEVMEVLLEGFERQVATGP